MSPALVGAVDGGNLAKQVQYLSHATNDRMGMTPQSQKDLSVINLNARGAHVGLDPRGGHLASVEFEFGGKTIRPMHRAHWRTGENNGGVPEKFGSEVPQTLQSLSGDFFCVPFSRDDITDGPQHGPAANGTWREARRETTASGETVEFKLDQTILGAELVKTIELRAGNPIVYQKHAFIGGEGATSLAHHPMIRTQGGARLSFSKKLFGATPPGAVESEPAQGRSALLYPQIFDDLSEVQLAAGGTIDLRNQPGPDGCEDFLLMAEDPANAFGWTAAVLQGQGFIYFALRDPRVLPVTLLWLSNGGRNYAPWNGRHRYVLGVEEACTFFGAGSVESAAPNWLNERGVKTALTLDPAGVTEVRLAFGAVPVPTGWSEIADIRLTADRVHLRDISGGEIAVPFDPSLAGINL
jgi:hypothetical protein